MYKSIKWIEVYKNCITHYIFFSCRLKCTVISKVWGNDALNVGVHVHRYKPMYMYMYMHTCRLHVHRSMVTTSALFCIVIHVHVY